MCSIMLTGNLAHYLVKAHWIVAGLVESTDITMK